ncbi:MAG: hypothetical protein C0524_03115 [Rhodobacter sp.]|nr:hypothetical protein [Rhodobacter sp.]
MIGLRGFLKDETGTATIELMFVLPITLTIFFASFETGLVMLRSVMLERSVDIVVRDIRLGNLEGTQPPELKKLICETSALVGSIQTCVESMKIWMQPIDTADFAMIAPPRYCIDKGEDIATENLGEDAADVFAYGDGNQIMLMRICLKERPWFPTTVVGAGLISGGEDDGTYALLVTSVYVNEPG